MPDVEENAFQIARYLVENGVKFTEWGTIRQELGLSLRDFEIAYNFLCGHKCCHSAGQPTDGASLFVDSAIYELYSKMSGERIPLTRDSETLLKYLIGIQSPDRYLSDANDIMAGLNFDEKRYKLACQSLSDYDFIKGFPADDNPYYTVAVLPQGRITARFNFRLSQATKNSINTGDIITNIKGDNNSFTIGSVFSDVYQSINGNAFINDLVKDKLEILLQQLQDKLQEVPKENIEDAEAIAELAKTLVNNSTIEKPNKLLVEITADGLKKAAENLAAILPDILTISMSIISFITKLPTH
jgi:hypothetical protein